MTHRLRGLGIAVAERFLRGTLDTEQATGLVDFMLGWFSHEKAEGLSELLSFCESPMERTFLLGLCCGSESPFVLDSIVDGSQDWENCAVAAFLNDRHGDAYILVLQQEVTEWDDDAKDEKVFARVDFMLGPKGIPVNLAIEIDGHEFHEKTKEQAQRDKQRDRRLVRGGSTVLRFTGSEVYADPYAAAEEIFSTMDAICTSFDMDRGVLARKVLIGLGASTDEASRLVREQIGLPPLLPEKKQDDTEGSE